MIRLLRMKPFSTNTQNSSILESSAKTHPIPDEDCNRCSPLLCGISPRVLERIEPFCKPFSHNTPPTTTYLTYKLLVSKNRWEIERHGEISCLFSQNGFGNGFNQRRKNEGVLLL